MIRIKHNLQFRKYSKSPMRVPAMYAFGAAKLAVSKLEVSTDLSVYTNNTSDSMTMINTVQMLLQKCGLEAEAVPLSCMQLAICQPMVVDLKNSYDQQKQVNANEDWNWY